MCALSSLSLSVNITNFQANLRLQDFHYFIPPDGSSQGHIPEH